MWISAILLLPCGASLGYGLSVLSGLSAKAARTVALETGIQNTTLTIAVIVFAYPRGEEGDVGYEAAKDLQDKLLAFPLMFSLFLIITACLMTLLFRHIASEEDKKSSEEIAQEKAEKEKEEVENNTI